MCPLPLVAEIRVQFLVLPGAPAAGAPAAGARVMLDRNGSERSIKMKNEVKHTRARSKTHIRPEDEENTKEERSDEKDWFESFIEFRSR
jgi:hypothetical protein